MRVILRVFIIICLCSLVAVAEEQESKKITVPEQITVTGELRIRNENRFNFSPAYPTDDSYGFTLMRSRLGLQANLSEDIEMFVQFQDSRTFASESSVTADTKNVDLHQAYFIWKNINGSDFSLKAGRQEFLYGDQRLLGIGYWTNVGRSFDGVKLVYDTKRFKVDGLYATTKETMTSDVDASLFGVYSTLKSTPVGNVDLYGLFKNDPDDNYLSEIVSNGYSDLDLMTFGLRLDGSKLKNSPLTYKGEFMFQTGSKGGDDISAYAYHLEGHYKLVKNTSLLVEYNFASGDEDPADGTIGTFDQLYPGNHLKYGYIDFIGLRNMLNLCFGVKFVPIKGHTAVLNYHKFWRESSMDNVYRANGKVILPFTPGIESNDIGQEIDFTWSTSPVKGMGVLAGVAYFVAGDLYKETYPDRDVDNGAWVFIQTMIKF